MKERQIGSDSLAHIAEDSRHKSGSRSGWPQGFKWRQQDLPLGLPSISGQLSPLESKVGQWQV